MIELVSVASRRALLAGMVFSAGLLAGAGSALAQASTTSVPLADVMVAGPLGDRVIGKDDAPVTIVEYASLTCVHCATFHNETVPALKAKYIESGKVRLIFREFPFDPLATAASMLARCAPEPRYFPMIEVMFKQQETWARGAKPLDELLAIARQAGFTQESFEACLKNQSVYDGINAVRKRGSEVLNVNSTPTLFINGQKRSGALSIEELDKIIEPLLPK